MDQYDKVERIAQKAGVSFETAKNALEACNWDMLDAMILLEKQSASAATQKTETFSTDYEAQPGYRSVDARPEKKTAHEKRTEKRNPSGRNCGEKFKELLKKSHENHLCISKRNKEIFVSLPIWLAIIIALCFWKLSIILVIVALVCGFKFTLDGPDRASMESINRAADAAGKAMSGAAESFKRSMDESRKNKSSNVSDGTEEPEPEQSSFEQNEEVPAKSAEQFEAEDFGGLVNGCTDDCVVTDNGKITLEL